MRISQRAYAGLLVTLLLIAGCGSAPQQSQPQTRGPQVAEPTLPVVLTRDPRTLGPATPDAQLAIEAAQAQILASAENQLIGYWVGSFGKNKINLALAEAANGQAKGHSICAGNYRPIAGSMTDLGQGRYRFEMAEPGDDPYDGRFTFDIQLGTSLLQGEWVPFRAQGNSPKTFTLQKRPYVYRTDVGDFPQASTGLLTTQDVENFHPEELALMRNEIYARHGYSFKNKDFRYYFEAKDWYMPMGVDIRGRLTETEAQNIDLIYTYERYYEEYYDEFGR